VNGPALIYLLCMAASLLCAGLLARAYLRDRTRLLFWTAIGFAFFALNNLTLAADMLIFPQIDLWPLRQAFLAAGLAALLIGFVWDLR
jgi:hypothetical protein